MILRVTAIMMIFISNTFGETCIPFIKDQHENEYDCLLYPERVWRFNSTTGIFDKLEHLKPNRSALCSVDFSSELEEKILNVAVDEFKPYLIFDENMTKITGFFGDAWTILEEALKFRSVYQPSFDYSIIKTGTVDVLLTTSLMKVQPTAFYAHSTVIGKNSYSLFALSEGTFVSKWWYMRIFDQYVWMLSTLFVIVLTFTMMFFHDLKKKWSNQPEYYEEFGFPTFNLMCVLGATSGQGFQVLPRTWSLRLCTLTALNMGMLLSCGFNSTLTSYLAFRAPYVAMNSLDDVLKLGTHSLCVRNYSLAHYELKKTIITSDEISAARKKKLLKLVNKNCPDMEEKMELRTNLCKPGFVYLEASDVFLKEYRHVQDKCQIVKIPGDYWRSKISFLHYRGSKYRKTIDSYLLRLKSTGILKYLEAKWSFQQDLQHGVFSNFQPVELDHVQLLLIGLAIMMVLSVIICIIENVWYVFHDNSIKSASSCPNENLQHNSMYEILIITKYAMKAKRLQNRYRKNSILKRLTKL